jgi:RimJ/RimL family protein N-acetyltransferase
VELRDEDLLLRPMNEGDADAVYEACQDLEIQRWIQVIPSPYTEADASAYVEEARRSWADGKGGSFAIVDATSGELVGAIGVRLGEIGAVGYWVKREARGREVATRAVGLLSRWALTEGGVERLELLTNPDNLASQRVAEKAGFQREGLLRSRMRRRDGQRSDSVIFSLLPGDLR